jgi:hypothetical protein
VVDHDGLTEDVPGDYHLIHHPGFREMVPRAREMGIVGLGRTQAEGVNVRMIGEGTTGTPGKPGEEGKSPPLPPPEIPQGFAGL